jgi:hypothetical protein
MKHVAHIKMSFQICTYLRNQKLYYLKPKTFTTLINEAFLHMHKFYFILFSPPASSPLDRQIWFGDRLWHQVVIVSSESQLRWVELWSSLPSPTSITTGTINDLLHIHKLRHTHT